MSSAVKKGNEQGYYYKIKQLEETLTKLFPNVCGQINEKKINMRDTKRHKQKDGFYMVILTQSIRECHAVLIYKETQPDETTRFYIYDPNGKYWAKKYDFASKIVLDKPFEIDFSMTPDNVINEDGNCALWCIIVIILWNSFKQEDRWTALNIFNSKMRESYEIRKHFIHGIIQLMADYRDFSSISLTLQFIQHVKAHICALSITLPCDI
jgi:hypothetical protein